jgi:hypothetical protein
MKISFELEKKDILAFHLHTIFHNKILRILYLGSILFQGYNAFSPLIRWLISENALQMFDTKTILTVILQSGTTFALNILTSIIIFIVVNAVYLFFLMLKYKSNDGTLGHHLIELRENNLLEVSDVNETLHSWKSVQKIMEWRKYVLIYVSPTNAHIIPKRCFNSSEEVKIFIDEAQRLKESAKTNFSPSYLASNS